MKRMSEVFQLPVKASLMGDDHAGEITKSGEEHYCIEDGGYWMASNIEHAEAAAHAINNVDALADALECIVMNAEDSAFESWIDKYHPSGDVSEVQYKFEQSSEFKDFIDKFGDAQKALAAYRGAK